MCAIAWSSGWNATATQSRAPCCCCATPHADAAAIVQRANEKLAPFQQMRQWHVWSEGDFPRTPTQKPILRQVKDVVERELTGRSSAGEASAQGSTPVSEILRRISGSASPSAGELAKLQLSSIERVELLSALEDRYQVDLSETDFTKADTVAKLEHLVERRPEPARTFHYPRWSQTLVIRWIRTAAFYLLQRPAMLILGWPKIRGRENLSGVAGPVLIVVAITLATSIPRTSRCAPRAIAPRLGVAMDGELLESMRKPPEEPACSHLFLQVQSYLAVALFNVFPLPQRSGFRKSFAFAGELVDRGYSVLVFPEGARTQNGLMNSFRSGIGLLATRLNVPVVPMRIDGLFERKMEGKHWAPPGWVRVAIGAPVKFDEEMPPEEIARDLERRVAALADPSVPTRKFSAK